MNQKKAVGKFVHVTYKGEWKKFNYSTPEMAAYVASLKGLSYHRDMNCLQAFGDDGKMTTVTSIIKKGGYKPNLSTRGRKAQIDDADLYTFIGEALRRDDPVSYLAKKTGYSEFTCKNYLSNRKFTKLSVAQAKIVEDALRKEA